VPLAYITNFDFVLLSIDELSVCTAMYNVLIIHVVTAQEGIDAQRELALSSSTIGSSSSSSDTKTSLQQLHQDKLARHRLRLAVHFRLEKKILLYDALQYLSSLSKQQLENPRAMAFTGPMRRMRPMQ
jgi:hypothetical protein